MINQFSTFEAVDFDNIEMFQPDWEAIDSTLAEQQLTYDAGTALTDLPIDAFGQIDKQKASEILSARDEWMNDVSNIYATKGINAGNKALKEMSRAFQQDYTNPNSLVYNIQENAKSLRENIAKLDEWDAPSEMKDTMRDFITNEWKGTLVNGEISTYSPQALAEYQDVTQKAIDLTDKMTPEQLSEFNMYWENGYLFDEETQTRIKSPEEILRRVAPILKHDPKINAYLTQSESLKAYKQGLTKENFNDWKTSQDEKTQALIDSTDDPILKEGFKSLFVESNTYDDYIQERVTEEITGVSKDVADLMQIYEEGKSRKLLNDLNKAKGTSNSNDGSGDDKEDINIPMAPILIEYTGTTTIGQIANELGQGQPGQYDMNYNDYSENATRLYNNAIKSIDSNTSLNNVWKDLKQKSGIDKDVENPLKFEKIKNDEGEVISVGLNMTEQEYMSSMRSAGVSEGDAIQAWNTIKAGALLEVQSKVNEAWYDFQDVEKFNKIFTEKWNNNEYGEPRTDYYTNLQTQLKSENESFEKLNKEVNSVISDANARILQLEEANENLNQLIQSGDTEGWRQSRKSYIDENNAKIAKEKQRILDQQERLKEQQEKIKEIENKKTKSLNEFKEIQKQKSWKDYVKTDKQVAYYQSAVFDFGNIALSGKAVDINAVNEAKRVALKQAQMSINSDDAEIYFFQNPNRDIAVKGSFLAKNESKKIKEAFDYALNNPEDQSLKLAFDQRPTGSYELYYVFDLTDSEGNVADVTRGNNVSNTIMMKVPDSQKKLMGEFAGIDTIMELDQANKVERSLDQDGRFSEEHIVNNNKITAEVTRSIEGTDYERNNIKTKMTLTSDSGEKVILSVSDSYTAGAMNSKIYQLGESARLAKAQGVTIPEFTEMLKHSWRGTRFGQQADNTYEQLAKMMYETANLEESPYMNHWSNRDNYLNALKKLESAGGTAKSNPNSNAAGQYHIILNNKSDYAKKAYAIHNNTDKIPATISQDDLNILRNRLKTDESFDNQVMGEVYNSQLNEAIALVNRYGFNDITPEQIVPLIHFLGSRDATIFLNAWTNPPQGRDPMEYAQEELDKVQRKESRYYNSQGSPLNLPVNQYMNKINEYAFGRPTQ